MQTDEAHKTFISDNKRKRIALTLHHFSVVVDKPQNERK